MFPFPGISASWGGSVMTEYVRGPMQAAGAWACLRGGGQPDGEHCPREPMAAHLPQDPGWTLLKG